MDQQERSGCLATRGLHRPGANLAAAGGVAGGARRREWGLYLRIFTSVSPQGKKQDANIKAELPPLGNWVVFESFINQIPRIQGDLFSSN